MKGDLQLIRGGQTTTASGSNTTGQGSTTIGPSSCAAGTAWDWRTQKCVATAQGQTTTTTATPPATPIASVTAAVTSAASTLGPWVQIAFWAIVALLVWKLGSKLVKKI